MPTKNSNEPVWDIIRRRARNRVSSSVNTLEELTHVLLKAWKQLKQDTMRNLVHGMPGKRAFDHQFDDL